ncbi:hypothetical protein PM082_000404 [Marasmius tenuissimus]|nr:hypothetical protein PM082_000404 [Marasmius tenuissimus]
MDRELETPSSDDNTLFELLRSRQSTLKRVDLIIKSITTAPTSEEEILSFVMDPMFSKLTSVRLRFSDFTIDHAAVENVLELISRRTGSVTVAGDVDEGPGQGRICRLAEFCLSRVEGINSNDASPLRENLSSELSERIREAEREYGVSINIGKL